MKGKAEMEEGFNWRIGKISNIERARFKSYRE